MVTTVSTYVLLWLSLLVTTAAAAHHRHVEVPSPLIVGYASWNECDKKIIHAVEQGVNVVMWFAINLALNSSTGLPAITGGPDMDCVAYVVRSIDEMGLDTLHMVSVGGWDAPHPDTTNTAEATYEYWDYWNRNIAARPDKGDVSPSVSVRYSTALSSYASTNCSCMHTQASTASMASTGILKATTTSPHPTITSLWNVST